MRLFKTPLQLSPQASLAYAAGALFYDSVRRCLTFYNDDSNVSLQIGQEVWIQVRNITGSTIGNGAPVYINGMDSGLPTVALAKADLSSTVVALGLATEAIATGSNGFVTLLGTVNGLNTSAYTAGQTVYVSDATAGVLTTTAPLAPSFRYRVGKVTISDATAGAIDVTPSTATLGNGTANQMVGYSSASPAAQEVKTLTSGTGVDIVHTTGVVTFNKNGKVRVNTTTSSATPAINTDTTDHFTITALAAAITSMTSALSGTPTDGQKLLVRFKDNGTARAITWGTSFASSGVAPLLATTVANKTHMVGLIYDSAAAKWVCMAVDAAGY